MNALVGGGKYFSVPIATNDKTMNRRLTVITKRLIANSIFDKVDY
jgi:phosphoribosylformylglycinamidine (FGAM) synthase PurS component